MATHVRSGAAPTADLRDNQDTARAKSVGRPPVTRSASMDAHRKAGLRALNNGLDGEKDEVIALMIGVSRTQVRKWRGVDPEPETPPFALVMGLDPEARAKVYAAVEAECARRQR